MDKCHIRLYNERVNNALSELAKRVDAPTFFDMYNFVFDAEGNQFKQEFASWWANKAKLKTTLSLDTNTTLLANNIEKYYKENTVNRDATVRDNLATPEVFFYGYANGCSV